MIRSSSHSTKFANIGKQEDLNIFLFEYNRVKWELVDYFWNNKLIWARNRVLDIKNNKLDCPSFISTTNLPTATILSARALKIASGEALGIISSQIEKRKKQFYVLAKKQRLGDFESIKKLQSKIDSNPLSKPTNKNNTLFSNLDTNCCEFISANSNFDGFLKLKCLGKSFGNIYIPIKFTKNSNKFKNQGFELKTSWNIGIDQCCSRWEKEIAASSGTKIIGADQGATTCLSLSDGQVTSKDIHGHDLKSIMQKLNRKKKGSKAYKRTQDHRTNYINWSIQQLNLNNIGELRLEKLFQMRQGERTSSYLSRWTYTQINSAIKNLCELNGVRLVEQSATYRSQRCSGCGWVMKSNRKGKEFICRVCDFHIDADINGALNHEVDLYPLPFDIRQRKLNISGFYWKSDGIFDTSGQALIVPDNEKLMNRTPFN